MKQKVRKIRTKICGAVMAAAMLAGSMLPAVPVLAAEDGAAMGRYLETDVTLPEDFIIQDVTRTMEGTLRIFGVDQESLRYQMYDSSDGGETWEASGELAGEYTEETAYFLDVALAPDGGGAAVMMESTEDSDMDSWKFYIVVFDQDGNVTRAEQSTEMIGMTLAFSGEGQLIGNDENAGVMVIDRSTGEIESIIAENGGNVFDVCGGEVILLTDTGVQRYEIASAEPLERDEALEEALYGEGADDSPYRRTSSQGDVIVMDADEEGRLYYCIRNGIFSHTMGGSVVEQVLDGTLVSLADPNIIFGAMAVLEQSFYVVYYGSDGMSGLRKYTYDETVASVPQHELTVYSLTENSGIQQAVVMFQKLYPDTYVNYVTGMTGEDGVTAADALRTLNTDILAGNGPDILLLDGMSVETYAEKGILADLSGVLEELSAGEGIMENIAETYRDGDVVPAIPARFSIVVAAGKQEMLDQIDSLESLVSLAAQSGVLDASTVVELAELLYPVCAGSWKNEDNTIDQDKLTEFVRGVKQINDDFRANASEKEQMMIQEYDEGEYTSLADLGIEVDSITMWVLELLTGGSQVALGTLGDVTSYSGLTSVNRENGDCQVALLDGQLSKVFLPSCILSVLNTSKEQERAGDFVKYLLSRDAQIEIRNQGFPVNRTAFEESLYTDLFESGAGYTVGAGEYGADNYTSLTYSWPSEEELNALAEMAEELDTRADTEKVQKDVVLEETNRCVNGEISVDEAVNSIMQKINLYLAE